MNKIVLIGATGTIGKAVAAALQQREHEVIAVGRGSGALNADIADIQQVRALFDKIGKIDAVISAAGDIHFGPLAEITPEQFAIGLRSKLMGQVNVAQVAAQYLNDGGSITLTSGVLADTPIRYGAAATMTNAAVEGYVRGAAVELPRGLRLNVVSPSILQESLPAYGPYFSGWEAVPAARVAQAYVRSVEGVQTGQVFRVV
ncbi:short chain dehydrogenase [Massilia arenosa]|uniref:Short chain dehydrogenase n=1 Tax=Zemynaea arenosa TaxID=2561931 RepID=A0A4Y9RQH8_9BURK|nr:short chain dehydrogenase [Massilia arenosa]TFW11350.1 short chain dehydrogenase [Massilia arenosa]